MATAPLTIPALQPGDRIEEWRVLFESGTEHLRVDEASEKKAIQLLPNYLNRSISDIEAVKVVMKKANTLKEALDELSRVLDNPIDPFSAMQDLVQLKWQPGQDIGDYFFLTRRIASHAGTTLKFIGSLVSAQLPKEVQNRIKDTATTLDDDLEHPDAFKFISEVKATLTDKGFALNLGSKCAPQSTRIAVMIDEPKGSDDSLPDSQDRVAFARGKQGWKRKPKAHEYQEARGCYICGGRHLWRFCPEKHCAGCGQKGHILRNCPSAGKSKGGRDIMKAEVHNSITELSVLIPVKLNGMQVHALIDSGAGPSVIDIKTVCELGLEDLMMKKHAQIYGLSSQPVSVIGRLELTLDLGDDQTIEHSFQVLENTEATCILGRNLLRKFDTTEFDWHNQQIRLGNVWKDSRATIEGGEPLTRASIAILEDSTALGLTTLREVINPDLPPREKDQLSKLLHEFDNVFAPNPKCPRVVNGPTHIIDTGSARPIKQRPIPVAPAIEAEIDNIIEEMLSNGICRKSNSPWASRVLLVTKRDGSKRFVVDYRQLNECTKIDSYPMPIARDILDRMVGHKYFSFIDGASAYWSIEVDEADRYKTAFVTQRGLYEMNRMPFGLVNSSSSYQRLMDETLRHIDRADPFVDDTCIHSEDFEQHLADLQLTLEALACAGIQLKREKCSFGYPSGEFLGHSVTGDGHCPASRLVNKIKHAPVPTNKKQLQRFLGLTNFYRDYIRGFAEIASPLYSLTQDSHEWVWGKREESAFNSLRTRLSEYPVTLQYPDWSKEFILQTDASTVAVGGILSQAGNDGNVRPIAYFSSGLTEAQKKYSAGELECWAVIAATRKFIKYLRAATNVIIQTDHNPLVWLRGQKDPRGKFTRWILELESINYAIEYVTGVENASADYLSREDSPIDADINDEDKYFERHIFQLANGSLREELLNAQRDDPAIISAVEQLERNGMIEKGSFKSQSGMHLIGGLLHRGKRSVVPHSLREKILGLVHTEGHFGSEKTALQVRVRYFWKNMNKDVEDFCRRCTICALNKPKNLPPEKLVPSVQAVRPRQAIAFDVATLPYANSNHRNFLLVVDTFSKYVELVPLLDQEAHSIIEGLSLGWIYRHGPPESMISDQGPSVDGLEVRAFLDQLGIQKKHSTAYHPEGDGQAERGIRAVKQTIRCLIAEHELEVTDWPSLLPRVAYILNSVQSSSTGFSPYRVMFGVDPRPLSGAEIDPTARSSYDSMTEWVEDLQSMEVLVNEAVNDNLTQARAKMKSDYDKGKKDTECQPGDWVYLKNERRRSSLSPYYLGPFQVLLRRGPNVRIRLPSGREKVVHLNRCKACPPPNVELRISGNNPMDQSDREHSILTDSDTYSEAYSESDPDDTDGIVFGDMGGNLDTNLRRSTRERRPPLWLQEEAWPDGFSDDSQNAT